MATVLPITKSNGHSFEEFWDECPKKTGKPLARAKWDKIISEEGMQTCTLDKDSNSYVSINLHATPSEIIEGMRRYRKTQYDPNTYKLREGGRYTLMPATFLNQGRWMDE